MNRHRRVGALFVALFLALGIASLVLDWVARVKAAGVMAPRFEVDPMWPKPLPNHWLLGNAIGVGVDSNDHIWIIHRQASLEAMEDYAAANPPGPKRRAGVVEAECCEPAPPVLEFDEAGNLIGHWGGPGEGYDWPESNHGIFIDYKGNVWIGGNGRPLPALQGVARRRWRRTRGRSSARRRHRGAERPARARLFQRQHDPEVHPGGQIPHADRQARRQQGQQRRREPEGRRPKCSSIRRPTNCTWPMATATTA